MNEQDLKYMISTYQQKSFDLFNQLIASDSKVKQLSDLVEALTKKVNDQKEEIEALTNKTKRTTKTTTLFLIYLNRRGEEDLYLTRILCLWHVRQTC